MKLIAVVEGHGEVQAVPILLRRVLHEKLQIYDIVLEPPIRVPKSKLLKQGELERAVELAARRTAFAPVPFPRVNAHAPLRLSHTDL